MDISYAARQRLRQVMQNIERADEIVDALDLFLDRFTVIRGNFSSNDCTTIHEYGPAAGATTMVTFSVVGRENAANQAGFKIKNPLRTGSHSYICVELVMTCIGLKADSENVTQEDFRRWCVKNAKRL